MQPREVLELRHRREPRVGDAGAAQIEPHGLRSKRAEGREVRVPEPQPAFVQCSSMKCTLLASGTTDDSEARRGSHRLSIGRGHGHGRQGRTPGSQRTDHRLDRRLDVSRDLEFRDLAVNGAP